MERFTAAERKQLLFRRQFVLGPSFITKLSSWQKAKIGDRLFLQVHPDLELTQIKRGGIELTLLGFLLDPHNPETGNQEILEQLLSRIEAAHDIFEKTYSLGGRWILIWDNDKERILFNDAAGLRQVFYTDSSFAQNWCASQPGIMAEELGLNIDKNVENEFINSQYVKEQPEYWWPGVSSPFKGVKHLLPNHYLDLRKRVCYRYWPNARLNHIPLEKGAKKISEILKGLMKSASNRFDLALALTAGWDSRVLLAASKEVSQDIFYYTMILRKLTEESPDIKVPSRLLAKLGLSHNVIKCPATMDENLREIYKRNVVAARDDMVGNIVQGLYEHFPQNRACTKGSISSEIAKLNYMTSYSSAIANPQKVDGQTLARLSMGGNSFAAEQFGNWLLEAKETAERYNINIVELFGWEQMAGNWQAMGLSEFDTAQETFAPYNCRELLTTIWAVDMKFRKPPRFKLYEEIINNLWPEVLSEPINPVSTKQKVEYMFRRLLLKTKTYEVVRNLYHRIRKK